jgi:hypothetical protein
VNLIPREAGAKGWAWTAAFAKCERLLWGGPWVLFSVSRHPSGTGILWRAVRVTD